MKPAAENRKLKHTVNHVPSLRDESGILTPSPSPEGEGSKFIIINCIIHS